MPPGFTYVLRNNSGTILFGWLYQLERDDKQDGICCCVFHNASERLSSEIILEAESAAFNHWLPSHPMLRDIPLTRMFTYINPEHLRVSKRRGMEYCHFPPGTCFLKAGWRYALEDGSPYRSTKGLFLLEKYGDYILDKS